MGFKEISAEELKINPFTKIGKEWLLITAGNENGLNTMTASWGGLGVLWGKNTATIYIRPGRYTKKFVDTNDYMTISFLGAEHKKVMDICGSISGKNEDKIKKAGLTPYYIDDTVSFEEADMVLVCKKKYSAQIRPENFYDSTIDEKFYPAKDYHTIYISEIVKVLIKD